MDDWTDVAAVGDFPPGSVRTVDLDGTPVAVFNVDDRYLAIEDVCSHEYELLSLGEVEGEQVICPRHGARFSLVTGEALSAPACEPVSCFAVRIEAGMVQVRDDRWD